jgi:hypothetical protein
LKIRGKPFQQRNYYLKGHYNREMGIKGGKDGGIRVGERKGGG